MIQNFFADQQGLDWFVALVEVENRYFKDRTLKSRGQYRLLRDQMLAEEKPCPKPGDSPKKTAVRFLHHVCRRLVQQGIDLDPVQAQSKTLRVSQLDRNERGHFLDQYLAEREYTLRARYQTSAWVDPQAGGAKSSAITLLDRRNFYDAMRELEENRPTTCAILEMSFFGGFDKISDIARELGLDYANAYSRYKTGVRFLCKRLLERVQAKPNRESEQDRKFAKELNQRWAEEAVAGEFLQKKRAHGSAADEPTPEEAAAAKAEAAAGLAATVAEVSSEVLMAAEQQVNANYRKIRRLSRRVWTFPTRDIDADDLAQESAIRFWQRALKKQLDQQVDGLIRDTVKGAMSDIRRKKRAKKRGEDAPTQDLDELRRFT